MALGSRLYNYNSETMHGSSNIVLILFSISISPICLLIMQVAEDDEHFILQGTIFNCFLIGRFYFCKYSQHNEMNKI